MFIGSFSPADGSESEPYGFDLKRNLSPAEIISGAVFTLTLIEGTDADPPSRVLGPAAVSGTKVWQRLAALQPGASYILEAVVVTSLGNIISLSGRIACTS
jgi:hypothetical protein